MVKKMENKKEKNSFLIVWSSCIVILLVVCLIGVSKGTSAMSTACPSSTYEVDGKCCPNSTDVIKNGYCVSSSKNVVYNSTYGWICRTSTTAVDDYNDFTCSAGYSKSCTQTSPFGGTAASCFCYQALSSCGSLAKDKVEVGASSGDYGNSYACWFCNGQLKWQVGQNGCQYPVTNLVDKNGDGKINNYDCVAMNDGSSSSSSSSKPSSAPQFQCWFCNGQWKWQDGQNGCQYPDTSATTSSMCGTGNAEQTTCDSGHFTKEQVEHYGSTVCGSGKYWYVGPYADGCYTYSCAGEGCDYKDLNSCESATGKSCTIAAWGCYVPKTTCTQGKVYYSEARDLLRDKCPNGKGTVSCGSEGCCYAKCAEGCDYTNEHDCHEATNKSCVAKDGCWVPNTSVGGSGTWQCWFKDGEYVWSNTGAYPVPSSTCNGLAVCGNGYYSYQPEGKVCKSVLKGTTPDTVRCYYDCSDVCAEGTHKVYDIATGKYTCVADCECGDGEDCTDEEKSEQSMCWVCDGKYSWGLETSMKSDCSTYYYSSNSEANCKGTPTYVPTPGPVPSNPSVPSSSPSTPGKSSSKPVNSSSKPANSSSNPNESSKPVNSSNPSSSFKNVEENPKTGEITIFVIWILCLSSIAYSVYYFRNVKKED